MLKHYHLSNKSLWMGRHDEGETRFYQAIKYIDLNQESPPPGSITLIGFSSDEGVKRNQGREGAKEGPDQIKKALARLLYNRDFPIYDAGSISCDDRDLESAQKELAEAVAKCPFSIVLGGGHELSWGQYQGIARQNLTVVNFDAHLDLREPSHEGGSSGSSFYQMANCLNPFNYYCIGLQPQANSPKLYKRAKEYNVQFLNFNELDKLDQFTTNILSTKNPIYLSICLDLFQAAIAPGVSAPSPFGVRPEQILPSLKRLAESGSLVTIGIAELCPPCDIEQMTASLAAYLTSYLIEHLTLKA